MAVRSRASWIVAVAALAFAGAVLASTGKADAYVNPFAHGSWAPSRIDMGVDYIPSRREPVRAIGGAQILGSDRHSGWPGGHYIWYRLLGGDHKGEIIYVAENLRHLVPAGTRVHAGQK